MIIFDLFGAFLQFSFVEEVIIGFLVISMLLCSFVAERTYNTSTISAFRTFAIIAFVLLVFGYLLSDVSKSMTKIVSSISAVSYVEHILAYLFIGVIFSSLKYLWQVNIFGKWVSNYAKKYVKVQTVSFVYDLIMEDLRKHTSFSSSMFNFMNKVYTYASFNTFINDTSAKAESKDILDADGIKFIASCVKPRISNHLDSMIWTAFWWPISLIDMLIGELMYNFVKTMITSISKIISKIGSKIYDRHFQF